MSTLSRRGLLSGVAAVAVAPFMPAEPAGFWVTCHPTLTPPHPTVLAMAKEILRARMREDIMRGIVSFPPAFSRDFGFSTEGHKPRDTGGEG